jgi:gluconolactonase
MPKPPVPRLLFFATACTPAAPPLPATDPVSPVKLATLPCYTEGVVIDADGTIYLSVGRDSLKPQGVYRITPDEAQAPWYSLRMPNGHKILADGSHIIAGLGTVVHLSPDGSRLLDSLVTAPDGSPLGRPNDIALDARGGFYFTAPGATDDDFVHYRGRVFHADSLLHLTLAADSLCYPNGIAVHPDGRFLYLDDGCEGRVYRFPIGADARLGSRQLFATIPDTNPSLDGMTFDAEGRLYVAHFGAGLVEVLDQRGRLIRRYQSGQSLTSNVTFGGPGEGDLYVSGAEGERLGPGALYRLHLGVRGRPSGARPRP